MADVLNRTTKVYLSSVNTPDYPVEDWIINPDMAAVAGFESQYWIITGDIVTLMGAAQRQAVDDAAAEAEAAGAADGSPVVYGDGDDNVVQLTTDQSLTRDIYCKRFIVDAGVVVSTAGFRILARKSVVINGTLRNTGGAASGLTAGIGAVAATLGGGSNGATGGNAAGANGVSLNTDALPGLGNDGGNGGAGATAGGSGGNAKNANNQRVRPRRLDALIEMADTDAGVRVRFQGGAGGGAGGGNGGGNQGGGGGGGGGVLVLVSPKIIVASTGTISVAGGIGGNGVAGNSGGGGGGGGGLLAMVYQTLRERGTITLAGGAGGSGAGTGVVGLVGKDGKRIEIIDA
jgi:hypothetical protein